MPMAVQQAKPNKCRGPGTTTDSIPCFNDSNRNFAAAGNFKPCSRRNSSAVIVHGGIDETDKACRSLSLRHPLWRS